MDYLPLFFDLKSRPVLLVGGGTIALRKARLLLKAGADLTVVAPDICEELQNMVAQRSGRCVHAPFATSHLADHVLVISATNDEAVNKTVAEQCHKRQLPVNVVDSIALCSVIMPAIIDRSPLVIGVSSGGEAPVMARIVRSRLESTIPAAFGNLAKLASRYRDKVKNAFADGELRRRFWEKALNGPVQDQVLAGNDAEAETLLEKLIESPQTEVGEVYLVGAGPGDPDLLTFKALRLMQQAEVVLYDRLVSEPILDMVRRDAEQIYVGKKRSEHTMQQQDINQLLLSLAQQGKRVLRLKGGDPFIFGRGGEEIELLAQAGVAFQVVPGITAASGCACYSGIPLTHRDHAHSVRFVTGHLKDEFDELVWTELVSPEQTLVFYMGLSGLQQICEKLIAHGKDPETPAALVEKGTTPDQRVHTGNLKTLPDYVAKTDVHAPTLLIIGGVVSLHQQLAWFKR